MQRQCTQGIGNDYPAQTNTLALVWSKAPNSDDCRDLQAAEMLKEQRSSTSCEDSSDFPTGEPLDIRAIIQACTGLPADVASARLTRIDERIIDQHILSFLINESPSQDDDADWVTRQRCRIEALSPYLDKILICVFIPLPGIHYTIEIDPEIKRVVHWEWQTT